LIKDNGGKIAASVTKAVTHVVAADINSKKAAEAKTKGIPLVKESFLDESINAGKLVTGHAWNGDTSENKTAEKETKKKGTKRKATAEDGGEDGSRKEVFSGLTFCLSGTLSRKKSEIEKIIKAHGGKIAGNVNSSVTHVVAADDSSTKASKAAEKGIPVVKEEFLDACIAEGKIVSTEDGVENGEAKDEGEDEGEPEEDDPEMLDFYQPIQEPLEDVVETGWDKVDLAKLQKGLDKLDSACSKGGSGLDGCSECGAENWMVEIVQKYGKKADLLDSHRKFVERMRNLIQKYFPDSASLLDADPEN